MANLYEKMVKRQNANLYGSKIIELPTPNCITFYNGTREQPDETKLKLSDSFINKQTKSSLELTVVMLNVNHDHLYISKFREYNINEDEDKEDGAIKALDYCINNNVMADMSKEIEDMKHAIADKDIELQSKDAEIARLRQLLTANENC